MLSTNKDYYVRSKMRKAVRHTSDQEKYSLTVYGTIYHLYIGIWDIEYYLSLTPNLFLPMGVKYKTELIKLHIQR